MLKSLRKRADSPVSSSRTEEEIEEDQQCSAILSKWGNNFENIQTDYVSSHATLSSNIVLELKKKLSSTARDKTACHKTAITSDTATASAETGDCHETSPLDSFKL